MEALRLEARAGRDPARLHSVRIRRGVRVAHTALPHVYAFDLPEEGARLRLTTQPSPGLCLVGDRWRPVRYWREEERLFVATAVDAGDAVAAADLAEDSTWLLDLLHQRFAGDFARGNVALALKLVGLGAPVAGWAQLPVGMESAATILNEGQLRAVQIGLGSDLSGCWGPPGTGKTRALGFLVEGHVRSGRTCLVAVPSNLAADEGAEQICERLAADARFSRGLVLRYPHVHSPALSQRYGEHVDFRRVLDRIAARLHEELETLLLDPTGTVVRGDRIIQTADRIEQVSQQLRTLPQILLSRATVLVTTPQRLYMRNDLERMWDAVILDEAGMTALPDAVYAAGRARSHVTILGDFRQLPTVALSDALKVRQWYARDAFHASGLASGVIQGDEPPGLAVLTEQYRMAAGISAMVSQLFYQDRVVVHDSVRRRPAREDRFGNSSLYLVDSADLTPRTLYEPRRRRRTPEHAEIVARLVDSLLEDDPSLASIGIVAPYRDQVRLISQRLGRRRSWITVSTVHGLQGGEADVVIMDLVDCPGTGPLTYLNAPARDLSHDGARMLNVAASRARERLFVVADLGFLLDKLNRNSIGWMFLKYLDGEAQRVDPVSEFFPERKTA